MKVAIISDIHGNVEALKYFINYIDESNIKIVLNLGDIMGGVNPKEALKIIMNDNRFINVCGNHDSNLYYIDEELSKEELSWIKNIPLKRVEEVAGKRFLMVHSRINNNTDIPYLYNGGILEEFLNDYNGEWDYVLFGHTHYQCYLSFYEGKVMINPGSLGLSYDEKISFAVIDIDDERFNIEFRKIDYKR